jgi:hypothetical protein
MIVDAILFNDELELLKHRINWLRDYVDTTIILEADFTFSGIPKQFNAKSKLSELEGLTKGKVVILSMTKQNFNGNLPDNPWEKELAIRDFFIKHLAVNYPRTRIVFTDLDEIPSLEQMRLISQLDLDGSLQIFSIPMHTYYRYANWQLVGKNENSYVAKTFNSSFTPFFDMRFSNKFPKLLGKGSHLSYLAMTAEQITNKFEAFSHSELSGFRDLEDFFTRISDFYFIDHIGRFDDKGRGLIRVLNENQVNDICEYLAKTDSKFFRGGITPPTFKRLMASAVVTYLRKKKDAQKNLFHKFVDKSVEKNKEHIGTFSGLVILIHAFFMHFARNKYYFLKRYF